jgi:pullulanase
VSCHDNHTLFDRLKNSCPGESEEQLLQHAKFAQTIIFTSQGIPFLHAGEEFVRTKNGVENSFESSNEINQINWLNKEKYLDFFEYHKKLIRLRKEHPAFRMTDANMIAKHLEFLTFPMDNIVGYQLKNHANGDHWNRILLLFNGNTVGKKVDIPAGKWKMICKDGNLDVNGFGMITGTDVILSPRSALILVEE